MVHPLECLFPVPLDRRGGDGEHFSDFLSGQAAEAAHLDNLRLPFMLFGELVERLVDRNHRFESIVNQLRNVGYVDAAAGRLALVRQLSPRVVAEDPAHGLRRNGEKMRLIVKRHLLIDQAFEGLVDKRSCLKSVIGAFGGHPDPRHSV
jgi:hypothetical protein